MPIVTAAIATAAGAPLLLGTGASGWTTYTVRPGDTVWDIASKHRTDVRTLVRANHLSDGGHLIRAGATLRVPGRAHAGSSRPATTHRSPARTARYVVRSGDTISDLAVRLRVAPSTLLHLNHLDARGRIYAGQHLRVPATAARAQAKAKAARAVAARWTTYTVRTGDTVSHIAVRLGTSQATILKANHLRATSIIHVGQRLRVPRPTKPATRPSSANSFAGRTYADSVVRAAAANRRQLASRAVPGREATRRLIERTARRYGVDPALALAVGYQESGWNQRQVSVANAIGTMQVIPSSGQWASTLVGRRLNLLDAEDNVTAGVVILKALTSSAGRLDHAIAGYYQGLASVKSRGMHADTKQYVRNVLALKRQFA